MTDRRKNRHPAFDGIGQIEVEFLGQRIVIGCVEGEEHTAARLAKRFEIDAGEVTKAVSASIEPIQAMLMAGILAYAQIEEIEINRGTPLT